MAESLTSARLRKSSEGAKLRSSVRRASISGETFSDMLSEYILSVQRFRGSRVQGFRFSKRGFVMRLLIVLANVIVFSSTTIDAQAQRPSIQGVWRVADVTIAGSKQQAS